MRRAAFLALLAALAAGCGGEGALPPAGAPEVASGTFASGGTWALMETGDGELCIRVVADGAGSSGCTEETSTWMIGVLEAGSTTVVYAGLPCGVARIELRRGDLPLASAATTVSDDVTYGAVSSESGLGGVELLGLDRSGREAFRVARLDDDPSARVPAVPC